MRSLGQYGTKWNQARNRAFFRPLLGETSISWMTGSGTKWNQGRNQADSLQKMGYELCATWANAEPSGTKAGTKVFFDPSYAKRPFLLTTLTPIYITK